MAWFSSIEHQRWLSEQMRALVANARKSEVKTGFGYLTPDGDIDPTRPVDLASTARTTYVFCLASLMGIPGSRRYADHGITCLRKYFKDYEFGGWFAAIQHEPDGDGHGVPVDVWGARKWQYANAFLLLAAAAGTAANRSGAHELLQEAIENQEEYWWEPAVRRVRDSYDRTFDKCENYRGMNSTMHTCEAYLAVAEVTNDQSWIDRATAILQFIYEEASANNWRVVEHYDGQWKAMPDHNRDQPFHAFYPFGAVIGHQMEWARLALQVRAANRTLGRTAPEWLMEMAVELFERARVDGWRKNGEPGFVYTTDFDGEPVAKHHFQWVASEAVAAAVALRRAHLDDNADLGAVEHYSHCYRSWIDHLEEHIIKAPGVWVRELDEHNQPIETELPGRPDAYHPIQAMLMPRLPLWPPMALAISRGLLDKPQEPPQDRKGFSLFHRHK